MGLGDKRGVYKIENIRNGKVYIGCSSNVRVRKASHFSQLRNNKHSSARLQKEFNKYGENNFVFSVIEYVTKGEMVVRENYWVRKYGSNIEGKGYNVRKYADRNTGIRHSEETKRKISNNRKGKSPSKYVISEELRKIKSDLCKKQGLHKYHTKETERKRKENIRKAWKGRTLTRKHVESIRKANLGSGNGMSKLTEKEVIQIKRMLRDTDLTQKRIAEMFKVSRETVGMIKRGVRWGHLQIEEDGINKINKGTQIKILGREEDRNGKRIK